MPDTIRVILEDLTGQEAPFDKETDREVTDLLAQSSVGYSQLNEHLLLLGYDRITPSFFQFLVDGSASPTDNGSAFTSLTELRAGVDRFRMYAILRFGNIKYAFKYLSTLTEDDLANELSIFDAIDISEFEKRHDPLITIEEIAGEKTYFLGYLIRRDLEDCLKKNPHDSEATQDWQERERIVEIGKRNHKAYLVSDHMDVYVATSMRERHEYQVVNRVAKDVFSQPVLEELKIRWFNPTQAYCEDRIDKGLAEGLMLKRATCTLYFAQESDTLGKDSELASTLVQGKPVIAYIPQVTECDQAKYVDDLIEMVRQGQQQADDSDLVLGQLQIFCPEAAWDDSDVISWVTNRPKIDLTAAKRKLGDCIREHYDKRAKNLKELHPLGIQVHLETGVANGVLVARSAEQCAELIRRVLTNTLEFRICEVKTGNQRLLLLREKMTNSVFRVVTGDRFLTNAFWNFYLTK